MQILGTYFSLQSSLNPSILLPEKRISGVARGDAVGAICVDEVYHLSMGLAFGRVGGSAGNSGFTVDGGSPSRTRGFSLSFEDHGTKLVSGFWYEDLAIIGSGRLLH